MPEFRRDPVTGRWVILSPERSKRPNDFRIDGATTTSAEDCPFCPGREAMTPPEVLAVRPAGLAPDVPGWSIRVVPNKYPALTRHGTIDRAHEGVFERMNGVGVHEVIIETTEHGASLATMSEGQVEQVLWAFRQRMLAAREDAQTRYVLIFKNHGAAAGATLEHPHAQLIGLPLVPSFAREEIDGATAHHTATGRCLFCDIVQREVDVGARVIVEDAETVAIAPYAPRFPYETWLLPRGHGARFEDASDETCRGMARTLQAVLQRMNRVLHEPAFNLVVHSAPFREAVDALYHWHVEVLPRLTYTAGFEWGTGLAINPTPPEEAAEVLRRA